MMTDLEIESLDYKLSRLKPSKSTCIKPGEWAYLSTDGSLHKLDNHGYYSPWRCDMWVSSYWNDGRWVMGCIHSSKSRLIQRLETAIYPKWTMGFGKGGEATQMQEENA